MQQSSYKGISLCKTLDKTLNKDVVVNGKITMSVAERDLLYQSLMAILTTTETALNMKKSAAIGKLVEYYLKKERVI